MATITKTKEQSRQKTRSTKLNKTKKPTEEQIRRKAQEIYDKRTARGEFGTEYDDWHQAEKILTES